MSEQLVTLPRGLLVLPCMAFGSGTLAQESEPFRTPNLSPPVAIVGMPVWSAVPDSPRYGFTTEVANHYRVSDHEADTLILDGETVRLRGYLEWPIGERWSIGMDVPYVYQSGGVLDDLVDGWHSAFGLPDGDRNRRREGVLEFDLANADGTFFRLAESDSGFGDIQLSAARQLGSSGDWTLRATVDLPTGEERILAGNGSMDWNVSLLRVVNGEVRGRAAGFYFGGAVIDYGQPEQIAYPVEGEAVAAVLGGGLAFGPRLGVKAQIDANSALYDTVLEELGQTGVQATIGFWYQFAESARVEFGVIEDLHVSTTPDVVIYMDLSWRSL